MSDAARASVNVNLNPHVLARLASKIGAPRSLTVHRIVDLSRVGLDESTCEVRVSQVLAMAQAEAATEIQNCRFRPQPNVLISLRLRENPLGPAGTKALAHALLLRAPLALRVLSVPGVGAGDAGVAALASALGATSAVHLISLDLSDNQLTGAAGVALATLLAARKQRLEELRLTRNPLGDTGVKGLSNGLVANAALQKLWLGHVGVGPDGIRALAAALRSHATLTSLSLPGNPALAGEAGCLAVSELLANARALERLWVGDSRLGASAASAIANAIDSGAHAPVGLAAGAGSPLSVSHGGGGSHGGNLDGSAGGAGLGLGSAVGSPVAAAGVASPPSSVAASVVAPSPGGGRSVPLACPLSYLWLERSNLHNDGAAGIAALLSTPHAAITELWIGGNGLADDAALLIAGALTSPTCNLRKLHVERNEITYAGAEALLTASVSSASSPLAELHLEGNVLSDADCIALHDMASHSVAQQQQQSAAAAHLLGHEEMLAHVLRLVLRDPRQVSCEPREPAAAGGGAIAASPPLPPGYEQQQQQQAGSLPRQWRHPLAVNLLPEGLLLSARLARASAPAPVPIAPVPNVEIAAGGDAQAAAANAIADPGDGDVEGGEGAPDSPSLGADAEADALLAEGEDAYAAAEAEAEAAVAELEAAAAAAAASPSKEGAAARAEEEEAPAAEAEGAD